MKHRDKNNREHDFLTKNGFLAIRIDKLSVHFFSYKGLLATRVSNKKVLRAQTFNGFILVLLMNLSSWFVRGGMVFSSLIRTPLAYTESERESERAAHKRPSKNSVLVSWS
jgi:hypothetical protein